MRTRRRVRQTIAVIAAAVSTAVLSPSMRADAIAGYGGLCLYVDAGFSPVCYIFWTRQYNLYVFYDLGDYGLNNVLSSAELGGSDAQYACDAYFYENRDGGGGFIFLRNRLGVVKRDLYNENQVVNFSNRTFDNGHAANDAVSSIAFKCYNIL
jgi:hypothetical protein